MKDINELKYLDISGTDSLQGMFYGCKSLSDLIPLKNWNVSNVKDLNDMFRDCASLSDITPFKIGMFLIVILFLVCSISVPHYQI